MPWGFCLWPLVQGPRPAVACRTFAFIPLWIRSRLAQLGTGQMCPDELPWSLAAHPQPSPASGRSDTLQPALGRGWGNGSLTSGAVSTSES